MNKYMFPISGKILRGGKGLRARSNKTILYVKNQKAMEDAKLIHGNKVIYKLISQL